jgi:hypothetical protein
VIGILGHYSYNIKKNAIELVLAHVTTRYDELDLAWLENV